MHACACTCACVHVCGWARLVTSGSFNYRNMLGVAARIFGVDTSAKADRNLPKLARNPSRVTCRITFHIRSFHIGVSLVMLCRTILPNLTIVVISFHTFSVHTVSYGTRSGGMRTMREEGEEEETRREKVAVRHAFFYHANSFPCSFCTHTMRDTVYMVDTLCRVRMRVCGLAWVGYGCSH